MIATGAVLLAYIAEATIVRMMRVVTRRTRNDLDDKLVELLRRPIFVSVILIGLGVASLQLRLPPAARYTIYGTLKTIAVIVFTIAAFRIGTALLHTLSEPERGSVVQPRTVPMFDFLIKSGVVGIAAYFFFLSWEIDVTAWLASAGIIGIAIGFGAKDTLANLFSGIFLIADPPYKIGEYIVLDGGLRGRVTRIGMRTTRVITDANIEVIVPNAILNTTKVVNEEGGTAMRQRIAVTITVAYDIRVAEMRELLLACAAQVPQVLTEPAAEVRILELGPSGPRFQLLAWIARAAEREHVLSELNIGVLEAVTRAGIEIASNKHDVYVNDRRRLNGDAPRPGSAPE